MVKVFLNEYERRARLYPALIVLAPIIIFLYFIVPQVRENTFISIIIALGLIDLLAVVSRYIGKRKEKALFTLWGGPPTTRFLRHSDDNIDPVTKKRYHEFLSESLPHSKIPTAKKELENPKFADIVYESSVRWLREKTRDIKCYPLVFRENTTYGFCRNLWALKEISISLLSATSLLNSYLAYIKYRLDIFKINYDFWLISLICLVLLLLWLFVIRKPFVQKAADGYARALLAVCEGTA